MSTKLPNKIVQFKTIVGLEVVAELIETQESGDIKVRRPMTLNIVGFSPNGQAELQLMPFFLLNPSEPIVIKQAMIGTSLLNAPASIEKEYLSQTSGLALV